MVEQITIQNLDHLGLIAGIIDDLDIETHIPHIAIKYEKQYKTTSIEHSK
jgi:hypothetical protein